MAAVSINIHEWCVQWCFSQNVINYRYLAAMGPALGLKTREDMMNFMCKKTGQKRILEPYEIGKVATFLCKGGRCITGMSINADGGIHLGWFELQWIVFISNNNWLIILWFIIADDWVLTHSWKDSYCISDSYKKNNYKELIYHWWYF